MPKLRPTVARMFVYGASLLAGAVAARYGYGFGQRISGMGLGLLLAANAGVFAALLAGVVLDRLSRSR